MYETERIYTNGLPSTSTTENWASVSEQNKTWKPNRKNTNHAKVSFLQSDFFKKPERQVNVPIWDNKAMLKTLAINSHLLSAIWG